MNYAKLHATIRPGDCLNGFKNGKTKRQPPAFSREANTDVTKTVIHRLAPKGSQSHRPPPHVKIPNSTAEKKKILVYIANFALRDNCERVNFVYNSSV